MFHDVFAHGDLAVGSDHHFVVASHAQYDGAVHPRGILAHWHQKIRAGPAATTNPRFKIDRYIVSISTVDCSGLFLRELFGPLGGNFRVALDPPRIDLFRS